MQAPHLQIQSYVTHSPFRRLKVCSLIAAKRIFGKAESDVINEIEFIQLQRCSCCFCCTSSIEMDGHGSLNESVYILSRGHCSYPYLRRNQTFTMLPRTVLFRLSHIPRPFCHRPNILAPTIRPFSTSLPLFSPSSSSNSNSNSNSDSQPGRKVDDSEGKRERPKATHPTKHKPRAVSSGQPVAEHTKEDEKKRSGLPEQPDESEF